MNDASVDRQRDERRDEVIQQSVAAYAELASDPKALRQELAERAIWDEALADGLAEADCWRDGEIPANLSANA